MLFMRVETGRECNDFSPIDKRKDRQDIPR